MILSIDPANVFTAYTLIEENYVPIEFEKTENELFVKKIKEKTFNNVRKVIIENISSYGNIAGKTTYETCVFIGRLYQLFSDIVGKENVELRYRHKIKKGFNLGKNGNDKGVREYLVNRFAKSSKNYGKGNKKSPDFFYGFADDIWQAYAVGVSFLDEEGANNG